MIWSPTVLYILSTAWFFALVSADLSNLQSPLSSCILTVQSTVVQVEDPRTLITFGIFNRFAISDPPANPLTVAGGGTADLFEDLGDGLYSIGFSVFSDTYGASQLKDIVTQQWNNTNLFEWDLGSSGNWGIVSVNC